MKKSKTWHEMLIGTSFQYSMSMDLSTRILLYVVDLSKVLSHYSLIINHYRIDCGVKLVRIMQPFVSERTLIEISHSIGWVCVYKESNVMHQVTIMFQFYFSVNNGASQNPYDLEFCDIFALNFSISI